MRIAIGVNLAWKRGRNVSRRTLLNCSCWIIPDSDEQILEIADALGDADCLDASIGGHVDGIEANFNREAESLDVANKSAVRSIELAGFQVKRVEMIRETINLDS